MAGQTLEYQTKVVSAIRAFTYLNDSTPVLHLLATAQPEETHPALLTGKARVISLKTAR